MCREKTDVAPGPRTFVVSISDVAVSPGDRINDHHFGRMAYQRTSQALPNLLEGEGGRTQSRGGEPAEQNVSTLCAVTMRPITERRLGFSVQRTENPSPNLKQQGSIFSQNGLTAGLDIEGQKLQKFNPSSYALSYQEVNVS